MQDAFDAFDEDFTAWAAAAEPAAAPKPEPAHAAAEQPQPRGNAGNGSRAHVGNGFRAHVRFAMRAFQGMVASAAAPEVCCCLCSAERARVSSVSARAPPAHSAGRCVCRLLVS